MAGLGAVGKCARILTVPTDDEADGLFAATPEGSRRKDDSPDEHGSGIVWTEFHMSTGYQCCTIGTNTLFET